MKFDPSDLFRRCRSVSPLLPILAVLAGVFVQPGVALAATVEAKDGNVFVLQDGQPRQLTRSGRDAEAILSPDQTFVVFSRMGNPDYSGAQGDCKSGAQADELMRIRVDGSGEERLLRGQDGKKPEESLCGFRRKQFTANGRTLYFLSPAWVVSSALHRFDMRTRTRTYVMPANDVVVLSACENAAYRDNLIVQQHRYYAVAGSYDWYWLYDRTGKKQKGPVGEYDGEKAVLDAIDGSGHCLP